MYDAISNSDKSKFIQIVKEGWDVKKRSSPFILGNKSLVRLDKKVENIKYVLAHRLIGAGNGGYFLLFTDKDTQQDELESDFSTTVIPINIDYNGIKVLDY